jgi:hypothetical protein
MKKNKIMDKQKIKEVLIKYTYPKLNGMSADEIAEIIIEPEPDEDVAGAYQNGER